MFLKLISGAEEEDEGEGRERGNVYPLSTIRFTGSVESAPLFCATSRITEAGTRSSFSCAGVYMVRSF